MLNRTNTLTQTQVAPAHTLPVRAGVGLKPEHFQEILATQPDIGFFEVHAENYKVRGGHFHHYPARIRERYPLYNTATLQRLCGHIEFSASTWNEATFLFARSGTTPVVATGVAPLGAGHHFSFLSIFDLGSASGRDQHAVRRPGCCPDGAGVQKRAGCSRSCQPCWNRI